MASRDDINGGARIYLRPAAILYGADAALAIAAGQACLLAGGPFAFTRLEVTLMAASGGFARHWLAVGDWGDWCQGLASDLRHQAQATFDSLTAARPGLDAWGGLSKKRGSPQIMGIINVTPDSFSDGGRYFARDAAIAQGRALVAAGADILDIGGESTRPGAAPVAEAEEMGRVLPVLGGLAGLGVPLSVDTRHASVMAAAVKSGAVIINDVSALTADPQSLAVAASCDASIILMHAQGDPQWMQNNPSYDNVLTEVYDYLQGRIDVCVKAGVARKRLVIDPGIGFGKNLDHNLALLSGLATFHGLGVPLLLGVSRKSFIGRLTGEASPAGRLSGALSVQVQAVLMGAQIIRTHDVAETVQAQKMVDAMTGNRGP